MAAKHPDTNAEFNPRTVKDTILSLLAEQNIDLMDEIITLKKCVTDSIEQLGGALD